MKRKATTIMVATGVALALCYAAGAFTSEVRTEESCTLCRAVRYSGHHYGVGFEHIEENAFTAWYRAHIDPKHGLDPGHPHNWQPSGCTRIVRSGFFPEEKECVAVPPIFNLRPDLQLEVLQHVPDTATQVAIIRSLNSPDQQANARRVNLLIDYHYVASTRMSWRAWWRQHAAEFGVTPPTGGQS